LKTKKKKQLDYSKLIFLSFGSVVNFSGNISEVQKRLSDKASRDIPYIRCSAHLLSLALKSVRDKYPTIKQTF